MPEGLELGAANRKRAHRGNPEPLPGGLTAWLTAPWRARRLLIEVVTFDMMQAP
jgi:hypothetical protein